VHFLHAFFVVSDDGKVPKTSSKSFSQNTPIFSVYYSLSTYTLFIYLSISLSLIVSYIPYNLSDQTFIIMSQVQLVRYKKGKRQFEIMTHPGSVLKYREGKMNLDQVLMVEEVFKNQHKGDVANHVEMK
jgi:Shwachman-Bodian-Diamond syndrome (SBDS) protein